MSGQVGYVFNDDKWKKFFFFNGWEIDFDKVRMVTLKRGEKVREVRCDYQEREEWYSQIWKSLMEMEPLL